jgi:hypothetical protein
LRGQPPQSYSQKKSEIVNKFTLDNVTFLWYIIGMKSKKIKARVNKEGLMGSKSRVHRVKRGRGSFRRRAKHSKVYA